MIPDNLLKPITHFIWDGHNLTKIWVKHKVDARECEQVFSDPQIQFAMNAVRESKEERWAVIGKTSQKRELLVVFAIRGQGIRVISARPMSRKERRKYG